MTMATSPTSGLSYSSVLEAISKWAAKHSNELTRADLNALKEVERRLQRMDTALQRMLSINENLCKKTLPEAHLDQASDVLSIRVPGSTETMKLKLNRADPNVPIGFDASAGVNAFTAGHASEGETQETS